MKKSFVLPLSILAALFAVSAPATDYYWIGDVSSDYAEAANWRVGSASGAVATTLPKNDDYSDGIYFTDDAVNKTVNVSEGRQVGRIYFVNATGYELTGNGLGGRKSVTASGTGEIAVIRGASEFGGIPISVSGGTLTLAWSLYFTGNGTITLSGEGGTLRLTGPVGGWSKDRCFQITGNDTLRLEGSPAFSLACKHVSLAAAGAKFVYRGTVADAESKFGVDTSGSNGIINEFDAVNYELVAADLGDGYVEVSLRYLGMPEVADAAIVRDANGAFAAAATLGAVSGTLIGIADDGVNAPVATTLGVDVAGGGTVTNTLAGLASGTAYKLFVAAENEVGAVTNEVGVFYNGVPQLAAVSAAQELGLVPAVGSVSIGAASAYPISVALLYEGADGAVEGQTFETPAASVTIPAGATTATFEIVPMTDGLVTADTSVTVSLGDGAYLLEPASTASIAILNAALPTEQNTWVAGPDSDGLASSAENWSKGVPTALSDILIDGSFSNVHMTWDAGVNGLSATVASWTQNENYTGTVTIPTTFDDSFPVFTVVGDCAVKGGVWTHPANGASPANRLAVTVGGDFTLAAAAKIDVDQKGLSGLPSGRSRGVYAGGNRTSLAVFGDVYEPTDLGLGGTKLRGGGAVHLVVAGDAVLNGRVTAISSNNTGTWTDPGSGTGGSVYIRAASATGAGSIDVSAPQIDRNTSAASGGRIAIVLTEAEELGLPAANLTAYGAEGTNDGSNISGASGAGTVFVKTAAQDHGTLYVKNRRRSLSGTYGLYPQSPYGTTQIPAGETWTFDEVVVSGSGVLMVPAGTTLRLPNGFASVSGPAPAALNSLVLTAGILYYGGMIDVGDAETHTLQGGWVFDAHSGAPYTFHGDVVVKDGAALGQLRFFHSASASIVSDLRVDGDLTVEPTGYLYARGTGYSFFGDSDGTFSHGGQIGWYGVTNVAAYGSVLHPATGGSVGLWDDSAAQYPGGGALKLTVSGALTLDGVALSDGAVDNGEYNAHGAGGSLDITAASLSGAGSIRADGFQNGCENSGQVVKPDTASLRGKYAASAGGRVAVRLTGTGAAFTPEWVSRITAKGCPKGQGYIASMSSGGTVYLQDAATAEGAGTVYIRNRADSTVITDAWTPFPSTKKGGEGEDFRNAELYVGDNARVMQTVADSRVRAATLEAGTKYDLRGGTLQVKRLVIDGAKVPAGTYLAADAAVAACFQDTLPEGQTAPGIVEVVPDATILLMR